MQYAYQKCKKIAGYVLRVPVTLEMIWVQFRYVHLKNNNKEI